MADDISKVYLNTGAATPSPVRRVTASGAECHCQCHKNPNVVHAFPCCRIESATTPAEVMGVQRWDASLDQSGFMERCDTGSYIHVEDYATLARQLADWNVNGPALAQQLELSKQREAHFTTQMLEARNAQQHAESQLAEATRRLGEVESYRDATFDGNAVYAALDERAKSRTSADNVADVLDALNRVARLASDSEGGNQNG